MDSITSLSQAEATSLTVAEMGELALIEQLRPFCAEVVGDDAALISVLPEHQLVVTSDLLVDTVHFSDRTTPPFTVGWRAAAANLSDLAAMGAQPLGITVALGLPGETPWLWLKALYQGMADCLAAHGGAIIGGDICRAQQRTVAITALGQVRPEQAIRRDTAVPGMSVVATGPHGASRAGLAVLLGELESAAAPGWIRAHQQPIPRFDVIEHLHQLIPLGSAAIAGMDSSDGLANALLQISRSSRIGMRIERDRIPLPPDLITAVGAQTALDWALYGGEDFELVLCLPPDVAQQVTQRGWAIAIGTTTDTGTVQLVSTDRDPAITTLTHRGFQHF